VTARPASSSGAPETIQLGDFFLDLIPSNVFTAASENQILPVMVFALFFGIGLVMAKSPATDRLQQVIEGMLEVTMKLINLFIKLAPIAIACLMFNLAALFGWDLLVRLAAYVGVAVGRDGDPHVRRLSAGHLDPWRAVADRLLQGPCASRWWWPSRPLRPTRLCRCR
jgi:Na+/H+-dicarboxylate symporter